MVYKYYPFRIVVSIIVILVLFSFWITAISNNRKDVIRTGTIDTIEADQMFVELTQYGSFPFKIVYNPETKVMYTVSNGIYCDGVLTLLVNADGTPMLYEED